MRKKGKEMLKRIAVIGICAITATTAQAFWPTNQIVARPLTPSEIATGLLPAGTQVSAGLKTVAVGTPVYLEAQILRLVATNINMKMVFTQVVWTATELTSSSSVALQASPLTNLTLWPSFDRGDFIKYIVPTNSAGEVIGRTLLVPATEGRYQVVAAVNARTGTAGIAWSVRITNIVVASTYLGVNVNCAYCHDGNNVAINDNLSGWSKTAHATAFTSKIDGSDGTDFDATCYSCHTLGYDAGTNALVHNEGFTDVASLSTWVAPATSMPGNWAGMPTVLKNKANIQCEVCHGPAGLHGGNTNNISVSVSAGPCAQCHDDEEKGYTKFAEWRQSMHGGGHNATHDYAWSATTDSQYCLLCHTGKGFVDQIDGDGKMTEGTWDEGISCSACHDPHGTNRFMVRTIADISIGATKPAPWDSSPSNTPPAAVITGGGLGKLCMQCHRTRYVNSSLTPEAGVHDSPVADLLAGVNGVEYGGFNIPLAEANPHMHVPNTCITCHMQNLQNDPNPVYSNAWKTAQGHTMWMTTTNGTAIVKGCLPCHVTDYNGDDVVDFDFSYRGEDYDGDGLVEGLQTEITGLLSNLVAMLPPPPGRNQASNLNTNQNKAYFNYNLVKVDGSLGVHNPSYAVSLLKASIADMKIGWNSATNQAPAGWRGTDWFGKFYPTGNNGWLYHAEHGWMYASFTSRTSIFLYTPDMGWLWTSETVYPFLYRYNDATWLWYLRGGVAPNRLFYKYSAPAGWEAPR